MEVSIPLFFKSPCKAWGRPLPSNRLMWRILDQHVINIKVDTYAFRSGQMDSLHTYMAFLPSDIKNLTPYKCMINSILFYLKPRLIGGSWKLFMASNNYKMWSSDYIPFRDFILNEWEVQLCAIIPSHLQKLSTSRCLVGLFKRLEIVCREVHTNKRPFMRWWNNT